MAGINPCSLSSSSSRSSSSSSSSSSTFWVLIKDNYRAIKHVKYILFKAHQNSYECFKLSKTGVWIIRVVG